MIEFGIVPKGAVAWDSEPVRRRTERAYLLGWGGALGLFAALRRKSRGSEKKTRNDAGAGLRTRVSENKAVTFTVSGRNAWKRDGDTPPLFGVLSRAPCTKGDLCEQKFAQVPSGAPAEIRTPDPLIKSQMLYQLSYRGVSHLCIISQRSRFVKFF